MSGEEGVMDLDAMSDEQLAELVEDARRVLAVRQTGAAIARDITGAVDPIVADNLQLLGDSWEHGRVSWDGETLTVAALPDYGDVEVPEPEPEEPEYPEWVQPTGAHNAYGQGDRVVFEGAVWESVHPGANTWSPRDYPPGWARVGDA